MRLLKFSVTTAIVWLSALLLGSCSDDMGIDNRDQDYGYVQFKLYKEASYESNSPETLDSRASKPQLDYLAEASKVKVTLLYGDQTIAQTLSLSAADNDLAEFGLRSEKLRLLSGSYKVVTFALFDANDQQIYIGSADDARIEVIPGGLTAQDLEVNVAPRGKVRFTFIKDTTDFANNPATRAVSRQYTLDEITTIDVIVRQEGTNTVTKLTGLKTKFAIHFPEEEHDFGYQTSTLSCDSLLSLPAGTYTVRGYNAYDTNKTLLEERKDIENMTFTVADNVTTKANVGIKLYESDEYIKDGYALYELWKALDGPNWYYIGENFPKGSNWDFNKDSDLWIYQPGVEVHSNGRVAKIVVSDYGFGGKVPAAIGQFTELIELYFGSHNDFNLIPDDPALAFNQTLSERSRNRLANHIAYANIIHPATQFSEPIAFGLKQRNISIPEIALYDKYTEKQIIDRKSGQQLIIRPYDTNWGTLSNRLESIDPAIGNLKKLEYLFIANSTIKELPDEMENLTALTDFELYNCPEMKKFPQVVTRMPALISANIANNLQWEADDLRDGLDALANGPAKDKIQILYCRGNNLKEIPKSFENFKKLGMLDMAMNKIEKLYPLGKDITPNKVLLDYNNLTSIPAGPEGYYCGLDQMEGFTASHNKLTKVPDIFNAKSVFKVTSVDFSNNDIDGFEGDDGAGTGTYKGINVETFSLTNNPKITKYPVCLAKSGSRVSYINLRACSIDEIPEGSFVGKNMAEMASIDLSYNHLSKLPNEWNAENLPYLYGVEFSYNKFDKFPFNPLNSAGLTVFGIRGQRDDNGERCLRSWPTGIYQHTGMRGLYIGSNDLRKIEDTISYLIFHLDISDNPNITFDAKDICYYWRTGVFNLIYDKTQNILNCDYMLK